MPEETQAGAKVQLERYVGEKLRGRITPDRLKTATMVVVGEILDDTLSVRWAYGIVDLVVAEVASIGRERAAGRGLPLAGSLETIYVDGGTFQMGSNDGGPDEFPAHPVTVDGFHMTVTEITFAQYDAFTDATNRSSPSDRGDLDLGFRLARSEP